MNEAAMLTLRRSSVLLTVVAAFLGIVLATALVVTSTRLNVAARRIGIAVDGVATSEDIAQGLVSLRDADDEVNRAAHAADVRRLTQEQAIKYVDSSAERYVVDRLATSVDRYLSALQTTTRDGSAGSELTASLFEESLNAARELRHINIDQSRRQLDLAARWDQMSNLFGVTAFVVFAIGLGWVAWWLQRRAFKPAIQLVGSIERYAKGDHSARAAEEGPAEFRSIAHRFNDMASALEQQRSAQLAFLAGVAHDLRTPLSALKMTAGMITADQPLPEEERIRRLFGRVQRQVDRMERMVDDLLDAARVEAGHLDLQIDQCDARELARSIVDLFEPARTHALVAIVPTEPVMLACDPVRIEQVLTNLVSNAIKYSPRGGPVRVTVARGAETVVFSVSDAGIGMVGADLEHIFEPFQRRIASKESIPGVGLGLFVARRIVEAHGGRITVTSVVGKGSTFAVHLPASR